METFHRYRRRGRRRRRGAHAARRASEGRVSSPAARGTTSSAATRRSRTSTRRSWTACCGSTGAAARGRARSRSSARRPARRSASSRSAAAMRRCARRSIGCSRERGIVADYMRIRGVPVRRRRWSSSSSAHERVFVVEQNRDAQLRTLLHRSRPAVPEEKLQSMLRLRRLPADRRATWSTASRSAAASSRSGAHDLDRRNRSRCTRSLKPNTLGLTVRDYEGAMSTLCAGCGHDSITAAIVQAFFELDIAAAHGREAVAASAARRRRRRTS